MAEKELQGQPLSEEDEAIIRSFGDTLEEVVLWVTGEKPEQDPAAIIADVATDPNKGEVLEVGIGNVHELYVVAPIPQADGALALTVARGGIFSYYEFPSQERLTDEAWRRRLENRRRLKADVKQGNSQTSRPSPAGSRWSRLPIRTSRLPFIASSGIGRTGCTIRLGIVEMTAALYHRSSGFRSTRPCWIKPRRQLLL